jgi:hypothetical protein
VDTTSQLARWDLEERLEEVVAEGTKRAEHLATVGLVEESHGHEQQAGVMAVN